MKGRKRTIAALAAGGLLLAAGWTGQGCTMVGDECACDLMYTWKEVAVLDAQGDPVDSAVIRVVRTSDGQSLPVPDQARAEKGKAIVFDDGITRKFPSGRLQMEIRVTASKDGKTGEQSFVLTTTECRCHFEVVSGRDTIVVR